MKTVIITGSTGLVGSESAYFFHKKFSFKDFKKIGLALYLENNVKINQDRKSVV